MIQEPIHYIGKIVKSIGYKGELVLNLEVSFNESMLDAEILFVELDGLPVPFYISHEGIYQKDENILVVKFDDIDDEFSVKALLKAKVSIKKYIENNNFDTSNINSLKGFLVKDINYGEIGNFEQIIEIPNNPLIQIFNKTTEILIPFIEDIIQEIDETKREILVSTPEGLVDVYLEK